MRPEVQAPSSVAAETEVELMVIWRQEIELRVDGNQFRGRTEVTFTRAYKDQKSDSIVRQYVMDVSTLCRVVQVQQIVRMM